MKTQTNSVLSMLRRLALLFFATALIAINVRTFVQAGGLIPGGFTGLVLLAQELALRYFGIHIPFSLLLYAMNAVPAFFCFRYVGKQFTILSLFSVILCGLMIDFMPAMFINFLSTYDILLSAVFGGLLNAVAVAIALSVGATLGGTDFIAIYISEKYRKDAWNYIFAGNCVILVIAGALFSLDRALYSIIFQFTATLAISYLYRAYQQKTLLVITNRPQQVYDLIREKTRHGATTISGTGMYDKAERTLLYSVVYSNEADPLIRLIRVIDPDAFINVIKTEQVNGRFFKKPLD